MFVPVVFVQMRFANVVGATPVTVKFAIVPFVAKKFVVVAFVEVTFVKTPVEGVVAPIVVPLIEPPEIVAFEEIKVGAVREEMDPDSALIVVPLAVAKPNQEVEVPFVKFRFEIVPFVIVPFVSTPFVANKLVDVVFVPVAFVQMRFAKDEGATPFTVNPFRVSVEPEAVLKLRLEIFAFTPVAFVNARLVNEDPEALESVFQMPET